MSGVNVGGAGKGSNLAVSAGASLEARGFNHNEIVNAGFGPDLRVGYSFPREAYERGSLEIIGESSYRDFFPGRGEVHHSLFHNSLGVKMKSEIDPKIFLSPVFLIGTTYNSSRDRVRPVALQGSGGLELDLAWSANLRFGMGLKILTGEMSLPTDVGMVIVSSQNLTYRF